MKQYSIKLICVIFFLHNTLDAAGLPTSPGNRVWENAADNVDITNTIESKVCNLTIPNDFSVTFTALDVGLSKMCIVASKAELLATQIDTTELNFNLDVSKVCAIEDNLTMIQLNLESFDTQGTFTALDALKQTVCSKIELLNQQLGGVQTEITELTATEIDHAATIASQLEVLDTEVVSINSILDVLNFDLKLNTACSLLDVIDGCLQTVESKVDLLDSTIQIGFAGTFTALDLNLAKACTIESLVDAIPMSFFADLSETFSALNMLQEKICTIDSKVDGLDMSIMSVESGIDILNSEFDPLISKLCIVESKSDAASTSIAFSLFDNAIQVLNQDCSILEELTNNQMLEKSCTIESNLDVITNELLTQESKLEIIDSNLEIVESKVCAVEMDGIALSKLCIIDSKLDVEQNTALTIESIIDSFNDTVSRYDVIEDLSETILSKLCIAELTTQGICSKLEEFALTVSTIASKLDQLLPAVPGSLCSDFGSSGTVTTSFGAGDSDARAAVLQSNGKIVAIGIFDGTGDNDFALARYNTDGSLDASFGTGGLVTTDFSGGSNDQGLAGVFQSDGKIVAVGSSNFAFALARYNTDGSLDSSFGTGGLVTTDFGVGGEIAFAALQSDGKIVALGEAGSAPNENFALARYNCDGSLDSSFGTGGLVTTSFGGNDQARAGLIQPDNKIIAIGRTDLGGGLFDFALARYNSDGSLDSSFGTGGMVTTDFGGGNNQAFAGVLQPDGKIVAVGRVNPLGSDDFGLARYTSDGSLDSSFGTGGLVTTPIGPNFDNPFAAVLQPDGKIVAVGRANAGGGITEFALVRYTSDGSLDSSFGTGGIVTTLIGTFDIAQAALLRSDGRLIAIGSATITTEQFALACYETGLQPIWFVKQEVELLCNQIEAVSTSTLISKLCLIEDQVCTVESNLDVLDSFIGVLNMQAQELIADFQETWTILEVIEDKVCTSESVLDGASDKLQSTLDDFSNVFTAIEGINQKAIIVDGKVNTAENLIDGLTGLDLSGIFTVLEVIQSKVCLTDDLVQTISAGIEDVKDCLGTAIFQSDVGTTGFVVPAAGRYYLAEDITFEPVVAVTAAIDIDGVNDVTIDLNNRTMRMPTSSTASSSAIGANNAENVRIMNGALDNFTNDIIFATDSSVNVIVEDVVVTNGRGTFTAGVRINSRNAVIRNSTVTGNEESGITCARSFNVVISNCLCSDNAGVNSSSINIPRASNVIVKDCVCNSSVRGIGVRATGNPVSIQDCSCNGNTLAGIVLTSNLAGAPVTGTNSTDVRRCVLTNNQEFGVRVFGRGPTMNPRIENCTIIKNSFYNNEVGIVVGPGSESPINNFFGFNTLIENVSNIDEISGAGAQTYLGNFAFNSTAVGDPNNTNYTVDGASDITRKFVTVSQDSSFTDRPTYWHNINMLP